MKSVKFKLIFIYLILVFIVMIISGTYIITTLKSKEIKNIEEELKANATYIQEQIISIYNEEEFQQALTQLLTKRYYNQNLQASVINSQGETIASTISVGYQHTNSVVISALAGNENFDESKKSIDQNGTIKEWLSYGYPIFNENLEVKYVIYVQADASEIKENISQIVQTIIVSVVIAFLLTILLGNLFSNTITSPISILTRKANLLAKGHLEQHIIVKSEDEIGQLTKSFNHMARELRKTVSELENENNKLGIVLNNITDGVVAFDEIGNLIQANQVFYELLNISQQDINLDLFFQKANIPKNEINFNKITELTVDVDNKFMQIILNPYKSKNRFIEGTMVVLKDITKQKKLDDMRKEFVANVSHEIRTPITTIKSYTETLLEGAIEEKDIAIDFLNTINEATDRMRLLTDDLLQLSKLDSKGITFNFEYANIYNIVKGCIKQNVISAKNKNQQIILLEPFFKNMEVYVDVGRVNQVLNNVISNSMKYSPEGTKIKISIDEVENRYEVSIEDRGMGIPKDDISRIFERFYRVDKARSRAMGGNGLGLSIAKEIMDAHFGKISVLSEVGVGTIMKVTFLKPDEFFKIQKLHESKN